LVYRDTAGAIDTESLVFTAGRDLIGLLQQDGSIPGDIPANTNLADLFTLSDSAASYMFEGRRYAFPEGVNTLMGTVTDRAGNAAPRDSVAFNATAMANNLMVILSSASLGTTGHVIPVGLINTTDLSGIDFRFNFDPAVLRVDSVRAAGRVQFAAWDNSDVAGGSGTVRTALLDLLGDRIPAGQGIVLEFYVTVDSGAAPGDVSITLSDLVAARPSGAAVGIIATDGWITVQ
ncbi:MAG: cohesin domain-containing protein, partial [Gemmatimonadales bacterium]